MSSATFDAQIKLWRLVSVDNLYGTAEGEPYWRGAMKLGSAVQNLRPIHGPVVPSVVPVLVDHDKTRPIGIVRLLFDYPDVDGDWLCAACTISDPPAWLKRGTAASISTQITGRSSEGRVVSGYVPEVSVLSPGTRPVEPRAKVMMLREAKPPRTQPRDLEVSFGHGQMIHRPGIGRVLAVR